ncbi:MAG: UDP-glucose/GDP-mannose dehydrogenase family protein [Dysgonamonadaceae bacterium]|jgi:UDPglucose 6-dehydrogenase|nr:UDP-glucose/GDP-mannose dehydrogenase family protein [Dysgonamonadaceae bacterium]
MDIAVVGTGYVGLVTGTCFSEMGINVTCVDIDEEKISKLERGFIPIYEPGLDELIKKNHQAGRLRFATDLTSCLDSVEVVFSAVGTPPDEDGSADLRYVLDVARTIGKNIKNYVLIVTKSTVPVGTAQKVKAAIQDELDKRGVSIPFDVASNPEFLKEGSAVKDFMGPDRVVVGIESTRAKELMDRLYKPFTLNHYRMIYTDIPSAEMIKYAANAMLATRISFMNDIANLCKLVGADVNRVRQGIGSDSRIGSKFLYPGCGYGGSCFPKDVKALIKTASHYGYDMQVLQAVENVNDKQKTILFEKLLRIFQGDGQPCSGESLLKGKTVALWGLSFKPDTDDMREAPSLVLIDLLLNAGCTVKVYDPIAMNECKRKLGDTVIYTRDMYDAALDSDALLLLTEWKEFRLPSWNVLKRTMNNPVVLDGRNIYDKKEMEENGFIYDCI